MLHSDYNSTNLAYKGANHWRVNDHMILDWQVLLKVLRTKSFRE